MSAKLHLGNGKGFKLVGLLLLAVVGFLASAQTLQSQAFSSGSTGADGALDYSSLPAGTIVTFDPTKFNPPINPAGDNIFNFTTITIPAGVTVRLSGRVLKGPVYWLTSGDVTINGTIDLNGENGVPTALLLDGRTRSMPGAGGFSGGVGGKVNGPQAQSGDGPGGGQGASVSDYPCNTFGYPTADIGAGGGFTGNSFLVPLVGGSGGGGGNVISSDLPEIPWGAGGGAGGGAILIASSTSITVNGAINANGGHGGAGVNSCGATGGGGAGGAIRLMAPTIGGNGTLSAAGGRGMPPNTINNWVQTGGANGAIRLETFTNNFVGSGTFQSAFTLGSPFSTFLPTVGPPSIAIASINGVNVSQPPTGVLATPDVSINTNSAVQMTVQASNIPLGTVITLHVFSDNNTDQTVQTTPLQGTLQSSTATATVTFPSGFSFNFVKATWTQ